MLPVASSFGSIPMPSELSDGVLLNVLRSYSSRYPSFQWAEEFASICPQWKHVIDTHRDELPRLFVDIVKLTGCRLEIHLQADDLHPKTGDPPQPTILEDDAANMASTLRRIAARSLIISLGKLIIIDRRLTDNSEEHEALEKVLACVGHAHLRAMSVSLETHGLLADSNVKQIMRAIGVADRLRVDIKCTRDIEALLLYFPSFVNNSKWILVPFFGFADGPSLDLLFCFSKRMISKIYGDFVIERYPFDVLQLANRMAKVTSISTTHWHLQNIISACSPLLNLFACRTKLCLLIMRSRTKNVTTLF